MLAAIKAMGANLDAAVEEIRAQLEDIKSVLERLL